MTDPAPLKCYDRYKPLHHALQVDGFSSQGILCGILLPVKRRCRIPECSPQVFKVSVVWCAGVLKVQGLMPPRCSMFDTPGVPHGHQLSSRLCAEEVQKTPANPPTFPLSFDTSSLAANAYATAHAFKCACGHAQDQEVISVSSSHVWYLGGSLQNPNTHMP